jgi:hypothetical protein
MQSGAQTLFHFTQRRPFNPVNELQVRVPGRDLLLFGCLAVQCIVDIMRSNRGTFRKHLLRSFPL